MSAGMVFGLAVSVGSGVFAQKEIVQETLPWDDARLLAEVLERVRQEYVEPVDDAELIESAVRGMVTDLDPHSQFLSSDEYEEVQISTSGNYSMATELSMCLNNKKAPTDDVNFRKALSYLFDYEMIPKYIFLGSPQCRGPVSADMPGHNPNLYQYSLNLEKAEEYLQKSKYGDKLDQYPIELLVNSSSADHEKIALSFQAQAEKVGIKVNISKAPWMTIVDRVSTVESTPNMVGIMVCPSYNEAGSALETRYHSKSVGKYIAAEWLQDKEIDAMIEDALATMDKEERFAKYYKIQEILVNDIVPTIWLVDYHFRVAYQGEYMEWPMMEAIKQGKNVTMVVEGGYYYFKDFKLYPEKMRK